MFPNPHHQLLGAYLHAGDVWPGFVSVCYISLPLHSEKQLELAIQSNKVQMELYGEDVLNKTDS